LWRNAGWLIADRGFRFLLVFSSGVMVTRHLGPSDAGQLGNALALAAIVAGLADLGLDGIIRRDVIQTPAAHGAILGTAFRLRVLATPVALAVFIWILLHDRGVKPGPGLVLGVGLTLCAPAILVLDSWFQSQTQARYAVWGLTAGLALGAGLRALGVAHDAPLSWFGWVAGIELIASGLVLAALYRHTAANHPPWRFDRAMAGQLVRSSWPLALTNLAILLYTRIDVVLLSQLRDPHETGLYTAAVRITEVGYILPMILVNTLFPLLARLHRDEPAKYLLMLQRLLITVAWGGLATALVLTLGAPMLVRTLYGAAFADTATVITIGAWSCIFAGLGAVRAQWLLLNHLQHYGLYYVVLGAVLNVVLNRWLIPPHGAAGAALAGLITQGFIVFVAPLFFAATRPCVPLLARAFLFSGLNAPRAPTTTA
jgi:PST family polysaccharide transporter